MLTSRGVGNNEVGEDVDEVYFSVATVVRARTEFTWWVLVPSPLYEKKMGENQRIRKRDVWMLELRQKSESGGSWREMVGMGGTTF